MKKLSSSFAILFACMFLIVSCDNPSNSDSTSEKTKTITVTFNANGGLLSDAGYSSAETKRKYNINLETASAVSLPTAASLNLKKNAYTFIGWATSSDANEVEYKDGGSLYSNTDLTLYALWYEGYGASVETLPTVLSAIPYAEDNYKINITGSWAEGDYTKIANALKTKENNLKKYILDFTLYNCSNRSFSNAFKDLKYLKSIVFADAYLIPSASEKPFENCTALESIVCSKETDTGFKTIDGVLFNGNTLWIYPRGKSTQNYTLPAGKTLSSYAFYKCTNLTEVDLPYTISTIPKRAFDGCSSLTAVDILPHDESGLCYEWKIDSPLYQDENIHTAAGYMATLLTGEYVGFNWIKQ